jgi:hypothetical protein
MPPGSALPRRAALPNRHLSSLLAYGGCDRAKCAYLRIPLSDRRQTRRRLAYITRRVLQPFSYEVST